jgi:hypothetical protein
LKACEKIPTKKQLLATIAMLAKQPATKIATGIKQVPTKLAVAIKEVSSAVCATAGSTKYVFVSTGWFLFSSRSLPSWQWPPKT